MADDETKHVVISRKEAGDKGLRFFFTNIPCRHGHNDRKNLQITCEACNLSKGAKDPVDFMRERGMLL